MLMRMKEICNVLSLSTPLIHFYLRLFLIHMYLK